MRLTVLLHINRAATRIVREQIDGNTSRLKRPKK